MSKGIVYILTNPCLDGWVKIGMSERNDVQERLRELNSPPNIPLSFRAYAVYEVDNPREVEQSIHTLIDLVDDSLHARETMANGRIREREFFQISEHKAYLIFEQVAKLRKDSEFLKRTLQTEEDAIEEEIAERTSSKRSKLTFELLDISIGTELSFLYDDNVECKTVNNVNRVEYDGKEYSISGLAAKLLRAKFGWSKTTTVQGGKYFLLNGKTLTDLRYEIEDRDIIQEAL
ncbi:MAG: GIY-YIG nuclease family protein [Oscillospiraceae bacterium]|nr:GIY-YIG nuclease family protein [Oscillospiraceae bacterium]